MYLMLFPSIALVILSGCVNVDGKTGMALPVEISELSDNGVFLGKNIEVNGFLSSYGNYYFVSGGTARPIGNFGPNGEGYWCAETPKSKDLWFKKGSVRFFDDSSAIPEGVGVGRRVILRGYLSGKVADEALEELNLLHVTDKDLAARSVGPLRHVVVLRILDDRCDIAGYALTEGPVKANAPD